MGKEGRQRRRCQPRLSFGAAVGQSRQRARKVRDSCQCGLRKDGEPWALKQVVSKANGSDQVPVGDACEECYSLHHDGFPYLTWEDPCSQNENDENVESNVTKARCVKSGSVAAPLVAESTATRDEYGIELRECFIALGESELRSVTDRKRLSKKLTLTF
ncbi:unnamed protein product [Prorocentrum cordatum]|uniref:Uncharacterized protein n=1 Tax=Prorocentrum cordatum TaxID=2364126 RepID=A0ABN9R2Q6_9DINO|nr:unnamed protein product [Polarella glacialis]